MISFKAYRYTINQNMSAICTFENSWAHSSIANVYFFKIQINYIVQPGYLRILTKLKSIAIFYFFI